MNVVWLEIPAKDINRAAKFYSVVFDQKLSPMTYEGRQFAMVEVAEGAVGISILQVDGFEPGEYGPLVYLDAGGDFDAKVAQIEVAGGKVVIPRSPMSETAVFATFMDTEGNTLALYADV